MCQGDFAIVLQYFLVVFINRNRHVLLIMPRIEKGPVSNYETGV
jgi:hypothetical protein